MNSYSIVLRRVLRDSHHITFFVNKRNLLFKNHVAIWNRRALLMCHTVLVFYNCSWFKKNTFWGFLSTAYYEENLYKAYVNWNQPSDVKANTVRVCAVSSSPHVETNIFPKFAFFFHIHKGFKGSRTLRQFTKRLYCHKVDHFTNKKLYLFYKNQHVLNNSSDKNLISSLLC